MGKREWNNFKMCDCVRVWEEAPIVCEKDVDSPTTALKNKQCMTL